MAYLARLHSLGFDRSRAAGPGRSRVECSDCSALVINGTACHEHGCPRAAHECLGCNALVPMHVRYCGDCR